MRVIIVSDLSDWVLFRIAQEMVRRLAGGVPFVHLVSHDSGFRTSFLKEQRRNDLVHFLSPWDFFQYASIVRLPCVMTVWHMVDWRQLDQFWSRADTVCTGSAQWQTHIIKRYGDSTPVRRMPYGVDTRTFRPRHGVRADFLKTVGGCLDSVVLGFAGSSWSNEGDRKGLDRMFECVRALAQRWRVLLRIVGRGWKESQIPADLREMVRVEGFLDYSNLPLFYSELDFYLCTSRSEGVPYPVVEAMSCETCVLSTTVGIVPEVVKDGVNGFVLEEQTLVRDCVKAVQFMRDAPDCAGVIGQRGRQTIVDRLDWDSLPNLGDVKTIYEEALTHHAVLPIRRLLRRWLQRTFRR